MPQLKQISNENPVIENKVNYFIDRFFHVNTYGGFEPGLDIENQLSLVEKINFHLTEDDQIRPDIFEVYFSNELFKEEDLWIETPSFKKVQRIIQEYLAADDRSRLRLLDGASLRRDLQNLETELTYKMPDILFDGLMSVIQCSMDIDEHEHVEKLNLFARLIVSEGYFSGKIRKEISDIVSRIFYKERNDFPFPSEVKPNKRKKYLNQNNLTNQLSGFKTIMQKQNQSNFVLMKVYADLGLKSDFEFKYNDTTYYGKKHPQLEKLKSDSELIGFFSADEYIIVRKKIEYFTESSILERMVTETKASLEYLAAVLGTNFELEKNENFLIINTKWECKGYHIIKMGKIRNGLGNETQRLNENPFEILSKVKASPSKDWLFKHEPLFVQAQRQQNITGYWQYLEALLPKNEQNKKQIRSLLPNILILTEKKNIEYRVISALYNSLDVFGNGAALLKMEYSDFLTARKQLFKGKIPKQVSSSNYPFIKQLLIAYNSKLDASYIEQVKSYYKLILTEGYSIRNFYIHSGFTNKKSEIKILKSLPQLVFRLRGLIFEQIKESPELPFNLLIEKMHKKSLVMQNRATKIPVKTPLNLISENPV